MKLFVDDVRKAPEGWTLARTAEEAIRLIARQKVDEISLDHDAGSEDRIADATFQPVAYFIGEKFYTVKKVDMHSQESHPMMITRPFLYPKITIHSLNQVGAKILHDILGDYGITAKIIPYSVADNPED